VFRIDVKTVGSILNAIVPTRELTKFLMTETVNMLCQEAKQLVRVRTGRLRDSLMWEVLDRGSRIEGWYGSNRPWRGSHSVPYAVFIELGFYHVRAKRFVGPFPYLRGALWSKAEEVRSIWRGRTIAITPRLKVRY